MRYQQAQASHQRHARMSPPRCVKPGRPLACCYGSIPFPPPCLPARQYLHTRTLPPTVEVELEGLNVVAAGTGNCIGVLCIVQVVDGVAKNNHRGLVVGGGIKLDLDLQRQRFLFVCLLVCVRVCSGRWGRGNPRGDEMVGEERRSNWD